MSEVAQKGHQMKRQRWIVDRRPGIGCGIKRLMQDHFLGVVEVPSLVVIELRKEESAPERHGRCPYENRGAQGQQNRAKPNAVAAPPV